jgi:hypothetical protein
VISLASGYSRLTLIEANPVDRRNQFISCDLRGGVNKPMNPETASLCTEIAVEHLLGVIPEIEAPELLASKAHFCGWFQKNIALQPRTGKNAFVVRDPALARPVFDPILCAVTTSWFVADSRAPFCTRKIGSSPGDSSQLQQLGWT